MTFGKRETLTYSTYQIHLHFGRSASSLQSSKNDDSNWTVFSYYFSKSLHLPLKVYDLSTHLPGNTIQITPNNAITTCSNWKEKNIPVFAWIFDRSFRSRFTTYSAESATLPSSLQGNIIQKQSGGKFFKWKEMLLYELKMGREKARCGNTCSAIKKTNNCLDCRLKICILTVSELRPYHSNTCRVYQVFPTLDAPGGK